MCSIAGVISNQPIPALTARNLASGLLYYGSDRGEQSTGAYIIGETNRLLKSAISPSEFIEKRKFQTLFDGKTTGMLLHTRQPTCGGRGDAQAQPFRVNDTVIVHNGTIAQPEKIRDEWHLTKNSGVDSELFADYIHAYGIEAIPTFMGDISGSAAVGTYHRGEYYLFRENNPIVSTTFSITNDWTMTVFASTNHILERALNYVWLCKKWDTDYLSEGKLYRITPDSKEEIGEWKTAHRYYSGGAVEHYKGSHWDSDTGQYWSKHMYMGE